jgi:dihydrolipoamide dehydrogenase
VVDKLVSGLDNLAGMRDIQLIHGRAVFESSQEVRIEGQSDFAHVKFQHAILASGSSPRTIPGVEFKEGGRIMSSAGALELPDIPDSLLVVGAGYIGLEMGTTYAALGSKVSVVEMESGILPGVEKDLARPLFRKIKVDFEALHFNTTVTRLEEDDQQVHVTIQEGDQDPQQLRFDRVLIAVGRNPNSKDLGLENTSVEVDQDGFVVVDEQMRTADSKIFAIGDVAGDPMLAHKAMFEGKVAAEVIAGKPAAYDVRAVPAVIYTDPQIAYAGLNAEQAREQGYEVEVGRSPWSASGRAVTMDERSGFTRLVLEKGSGRVLGMAVVGKGAEDLIAEGVLAVELGAVAEDLALSMHAHPTLSETVAEAAEDYLGLSTHIKPRKK